MTLLFERNDITKMQVDAIVNAANNTLLGGSGVDGAIHSVAGSELLEECRGLGGCETGHAKITKGYKLPAKYVIHTVGPIYVDGKHNEKQLLESCYKSSLIIAKEKGLQSIAFPLISSGVFGYPKGEAFDVAVNTIKEFFTGENAELDMTVTIVLFGKEIISINKDKCDDLKEYIDDNYACKLKEFIYYRNESTEDNRLKKSKSTNHKYPYMENGTLVCDDIYDESEFDYDEVLDKKITLDTAIKKLDDSFSEALLKIIDNKKLKDVDVYNKANMDRKLFSKIRSGNHPSKITAVSLCLALELNLKETNNLLKKAGYILSDSEYFDVIIKYHIKKRMYDVIEINKALFDYDQPLLGVA